jgi:hypothetical protein
VTAKLPREIRVSLDILRLHKRIAGQTAIRAPMEDKLARVVACFERLGMRWCLLGAQAVNLYVEPAPPRASTS